MFIIRDREAGNFICAYSTMEKAIEAVDSFEEEDKADGIYEENFYEIVEE